MSESIKILEEAIELVMQTGKVSRKGAVQLDNAIEEVKAVFQDYSRLKDGNQILIKERDNYVDKLLRLYEENPSLQDEFKGIEFQEGVIKELKPEQKETKELKSKPLTK